MHMIKTTKTTAAVLHCWYDYCITLGYIMAYNRYNITPYCHRRIRVGFRHAQAEGNWPGPTWQLSTVIIMVHIGFPAIL